MIMEVVAINGNCVEAAIKSPSLEMGEIVHCDKNIVVEEKYTVTSICYS